MNTVGPCTRIEAGIGDTRIEVIGVVADAPIGTVRDPHLPVAFRPMAQDLTRAGLPLAHVRVTGDRSVVRDGYVRALEAKGHHFVRGLFTFQKWTDNALLRERLIAGLSAAAVLLAVVRACLGLHGLLAFSVVTQRPRDRRPHDAGSLQSGIVAMVVRDALRVIVPGVLIGIPVAPQLARAQLYDIVPHDPKAIAGASALLLLTGSSRRSCRR